MSSLNLTFLMLLSLLLLCRKWVESPFSKLQRDEIIKWYWLNEKSNYSFLHVPKWYLTGDDNFTFDNFPLKWYRFVGISHPGKSDNLPNKCNKIWIIFPIVSDSLNLYRWSFCVCVCLWMYSTPEIIEFLNEFLSLGYVSAPHETIYQKLIYIQFLLFCLFI